MPVRSLLVAALLSVLAVKVRAQDLLLQRLIERGHHSAIRWGDFSDVRAAANTIYAENDWQPLWLARGRPTRAARALLDALTTVSERGLNPEDYDATQLGALAATLERGGADAEQAARFDAALTIGALRVVEALARGRVPRREAVPFDPLATVRQLRGTFAPGPLLTALEPTWSYYLVLKRALVGYRALLRDSAAWRLPKPRPSGVREGDPYVGATRLRRLLATLGDLSPQAAVPRGADSVFSTELADGVRRFQVRQGAHVDGTLNEASWRLLGTHLSRRIRQMELSLERWRWLPRGLETRETAPLLVSLPAMRLHYWSGLLPQPLGMRVSLGAAFDTREAVRAATLSSVLLHPSERRLGTILLPLDGALGLYLHGSAPSDSFDEEAGCIRLADAELLARVLLRGRPDWPLERLHRAMSGARPVSVSLRRSVPVLVVYGTAIARENGQVFFYPDAYGQDRRLEQQLGRGYPYGAVNSER
jgi:murein L,D-transpeptidase YcbB/YkuD